ncbi:hypothetical protein [Streptomyces omiyaensis]|uniref:hypothetical protein n=1 Tax=Streptomyces omiyaensis TaxID=68247 RepID=UPI0016757198|nr:hypothetical protein [Streptomyces omiyaensis]GGY54638.1 hypothetical protein GCM10010363_39880 [Streptomyces omiyaensis]
MPVPVRPVSGSSLLAYADGVRAVHADAFGPPPRCEGPERAGAHGVRVVTATAEDGADEAPALATAVRDRLADTPAEPPRLIATGTGVATGTDGRTR